MRLPVLNTSISQFADQSGGDLLSWILSCFAEKAVRNAKLLLCGAFRTTGNSCGGKVFPTLDYTGFPGSITLQIFILGQCFFLLFYFVVVIGFLHLSNSLGLVNLKYLSTSVSGFVSGYKVSIKSNPHRSCCDVPQPRHSLFTLQYEYETRRSTCGTWVFFKASVPPWRIWEHQSEVATHKLM